AQNSKNLLVSLNPSRPPVFPLMPGHAESLGVYSSTFSRFPLEPEFFDSAAAGKSFLLLSHMTYVTFYGFPIGTQGDGLVGEKKDIWQGTLALMILKTLEALGPLHGYGIARRIEQTSGDLLSLNYGTLYPALLKLEQEGFISSEWGVSDNNRKAKYYKLTRGGHRQLEKETREWQETTAILARFLEATEKP